MDDVRVRFSGIEAVEGHASLDARSFRRAALALATGQLPRHVQPQPVYIVAPTRRSRLPLVLIAVVVTAIVIDAALYVL